MPIARSSSSVNSIYFFSLTSAYENLTKLSDISDCDSFEAFRDDSLGMITVYSFFDSIYSASLNFLLRF